MHIIYIIIFLKNKKKTKGVNMLKNFYKLSREEKRNDVNMHMKNTETFQKKKKIKSTSMLAKDIETFLQSSVFLRKYKKKKKTISSKKFGWASVTVF